MSIANRYVQRLHPRLSGSDGGILKEKTFKQGSGFEFPCPFCAYLQKNPSKKRERCASFMPLKATNSYTFDCRRKQSFECMGSVSFTEFLRRFDPALFRQYHLEREQQGTTGKGYDLDKFDFGDCLNQHASTMATFFGQRHSNELNRVGIEST